jgi:CheY-like chemotaxis protein
MSDRRKHILFVDDAGFEMNDLGVALKFEGYGVTLVRSPREAQAWLDAGNKPDLLICDLMMEGTGDRSLEDSLYAGVRFAERQAERVGRWGCPILVLTGVLDEAVKKAASKVAAAVLNKPIDPDDLIREVEKVLARPRKPAAPTR